MLCFALSSGPDPFSPTTEGQAEGIAHARRATEQMKRQGWFCLFTVEKLFLKLALRGGAGKEEKSQEENLVNLHLPAQGNVFLFTFGRKGEKTAPPPSAGVPGVAPVPGPLV